MKWIYWDQHFSEASDPWDLLLGAHEAPEWSKIALATQERRRNKAVMRLGKAKNLTPSDS